MSRKVGQILSIVLLFVWAQAAFADTNWSSGRVAFNKGSYAAALEYFQAARADGLDSPAVHYNIAVCRFSLEEFDAAATEFRLIGRRFPKMRGLAEYNLGLIARRAGDSTAATQHFLASYRLSPDNETLRILSSNQLQELTPETNHVSNWAGATGVSVGYDSNVALRDEAGVASTVADDSPYLDFFASIIGPFSVESRVQLEGNLYVVRYLDADDFDQSEVSARLIYNWRPGDWRLQFGAQLSASALGSDSFDRKGGATFRAVRNLDQHASIVLSYRYDDVQEANAAFAGIAGSRHQLQGMYRWQSNGRRYSLRYQHEENDRLDPGVSGQRNAAIADIRYQPEDGWGYEAQIRYRSSRFTSLPLLRSEDLLTLKAGLTRSFAENWLMLFEVKFSNNDSSDDVFSYDHTQLTIGALRIF